MTHADVETELTREYAISDVPWPYRQRLETAVCAVSEQFGLTEATVFICGSWARGEAHEASDVDLRIVHDGPINCGGPLEDHLGSLRPPFGSHIDAQTHVQTPAESNHCGVRLYP